MLRIGPWGIEVGVVLFSGQLLANAPSPCTFVLNPEASHDDNVEVARICLVPERREAGVVLAGVVTVFVAAGTAWVMTEASHQAGHVGLGWANRMHDWAEPQMIDLFNGPLGRAIHAAEEKLASAFLSENGTGLTSEDERALKELYGQVEAELERLADEVDRGVPTELAREVEQLEQDLAKDFDDMDDDEKDMFIAAHNSAGAWWVGKTMLGGSGHSTAQRVVDRALSNMSAESAATARRAIAKLLSSWPGGAGH